MSKLKAYTAPNMEGRGLTDYYLKSEADKVIAELKAKLESVQQLEASFCVSREIVKGNGGVPLVGPGFPEAERWQVQDAKEVQK